MIVSGHTAGEFEAMDFYLDHLLHLPNMTVVGSRRQYGAAARVPQRHDEIGRASCRERV